jgi:hypothetical protein
MQVDMEPFPKNMIDYDGKKVLIQPSVADKGKGKEVIIGDVRNTNENNKNSCRKVVAKKTLDGGETLKFTITTSNVGGKRRHVTRCGYLFYTSLTVRRTDADGLGHRRTVRIIPADGPATPRNHGDHIPSTHDDQK